jgi:hypothetical protein
MLLDSSWTAPTNFSSRNDPFRDRISLLGCRIFRVMCQARHFAGTGAYAGTQVFRMRARRIAKLFAKLSSKMRMVAKAVGDLLKREAGILQDVRSWKAGGRDLALSTSI